MTNNNNLRLYLDIHAIQTVPRPISIGTTPAAPKRRSMAA